MTNHVLNWPISHVIVTCNFVNTRNRLGGYRVRIRIGVWGWGKDWGWGLGLGIEVKGFGIPLGDR